VVRALDVVFGAGAYGAGWSTYSSNNAGGVITAGDLVFNLTANASQFISIGKTTASANPLTLEFKVKTTSPTLRFDAFNGATFISGSVITLPAPAADGYRTVSVPWTTLFTTTAPTSVTTFYLNPAGGAAQTAQFNYIQLVN
jgi:hypothetical protein